MRKITLSLMLVTQAALAGTAWAAVPEVPEEMDVELSGIESGQPIGEKFAYCAPDGKGKTREGGNINPHVSWDDVPDGTQSFVLLVVDKDVPATFELANQFGKTIPADFPRQDFYHWVLTDIPAKTTIIAQGQDSKGVTPGGKMVEAMPYGVSGPNDYSKIYKGSWGGYDGPCPPWNDERMHNYHFQVYALDVPTLGLEPKATGGEVEEAMQGHILGKGEVVVTYTTNPKLLPK